LPPGSPLVSASGANAATANGTAIEKAAQRADQTILVREGCGRGRHWSRLQNRCVWN